MIKEIREYFINCPILNEYAKIGIDFIGQETPFYNIVKEPTAIVFKEYFDGSSIRQITFTFQSREIYGSDPIVNAGNLDLFDRFVEWIEQQDEIGNLPNIAGVQRIICTNQPTIFNTEKDKAIYQLQIRIEYYKGAKE